MPAETLFEQIVFSGGGTRCFWQGGFMHVLRRARPIHPERVCGVSGGALSVASFLADRGPQLLETMAAAFGRIHSNVDWHAPSEGIDGLTPHQRTYREVVFEVIDAEAQRCVAEGPDCQIYIAHPPSRDWAGTSGTAMALAYEAELNLRSTPHFGWAEKLGLEAERIDARAVAAEGRLADLVSVAATIPPVFEVPVWNGRPVVDAGMADQAPMPDPDRGRTLVLLTRRYRNLPDVQGRCYVMPSEETPADKIDFTDPGKVRRTWDLGERDARAFLDRVDTSEGGDR